MNLILRIYFFGLIAFVPSEDGRQLTALLMDARNGYVASDGSEVPPHDPMLLVRAASCEGDCHGEDQELANRIFGGGREAEPLDALRQLGQALQGGGGWLLAGNDLSVSSSADSDLPLLEFLRRSRGRRRGDNDPTPRMPRGVSEMGDFDWVANLSAAAPGGLEIDPDALTRFPQKGLVVTRFTLRHGTAGSYRLLDLDNRIVPLTFEPLERHAEPNTGAGASALPSQAMAVGVVVEVPLSTCSIRLNSESLAPGGPVRAMTLGGGDCGKGGLIEVAVLNLPRHGLHGEAHALLLDDAPDVASDRHFEMLYELAKCRTAYTQRPVPTYHRTLAQSGIPIEPESWPRSEFLDLLGLPGRGLLNPTLCIVGQFGGSG